MLLHTYLKQINTQLTLKATSYNSYSKLSKKKKNSSSFRRFYMTGITTATYKNKILSFLEQLATLRQAIYDKIILFLLNNIILKQIVLKYHTLLFYFRYGSEKIGSFIERFIHLNTFALLVSMICSRLHIAGYMIIFCLLFIRLDFAVLAMARFYKKNPSIFDKNFPWARSPHTRGMWTKAFQIASEAVTNPQVQTVGVAVIGALAWKGLDVYDTQTQREISEADRQAEATRQKEALDAEAIQREADRQAEATQRETDRQAAREQAAADRAEENRRTAYEKLVSPDFYALSEEQQNQIRETIETGKL